MVPIVKRHATLEKDDEFEGCFELTIDNMGHEIPYRSTLYIDDEKLEDLYFVLDQYFKLYAENPLGNKTKT